MRFCSPNTHVGYFVSRSQFDKQLRAFDRNVLCLSIQKFVGTQALEIRLHANSELADKRINSNTKLNCSIEMRRQVYEKSVEKKQRGRLGATTVFIRGKSNKDKIRLEETRNIYWDLGGVGGGLEGEFRIPK
jgi:hypothetical protein